MKKEVKKKSRGMSAFLKAKKKGSAYYEIIIKTLVFITMIATAVSFFSTPQRSDRFNGRYN